jgi:hypothetical protein
MDGREWLESYRVRLKEITVQAVRAREDLTRAVGTATSRDGAVTVTVGPSGALQGLVLSERTETMTRAQLTALVLETARRAQDDAARRAEAALRPLLGERSEAMAVMREHLGVPDGGR